MSKITKIVIFGAGGRGKEIMYLMDEFKYSVTAFLDNDNNLWGKKFLERDIYSPKNINSINYDYVVISIQEHSAKIVEQLVSLGVNRDSIIIWNSSDVISRLDNRIGFLRVCADRIKEINVPGSCAEVGVYKGDFAKWINYFLPEKKLYLFDTFDGFGKQNLLPDETKITQVDWQFRDTSEQEVLNKMYNPENCVIRKGYFPGTSEGIEDKFAFVSLDADLYEPIFEGLSYFYPRMEQGGYIFIHDYGTLIWPGVKKAVDEYCRLNNITIIPLLDRTCSCVVVKN